MSDNRIIGRNNALPWRLPADMKWFRKNTMGKPVVMGRKTYDSIGKPLPGRTNIIVTRDTGFQAKGCQVVYSIDEAIKVATAEQDEVMIIGGASFYEQILSRTDRLYLTLIHESFDGDAMFPEFNQDDWQEVERTDLKPDDDNHYSYSFVILDRKQM